MDKSIYVPQAGDIAWIDLDPRTGHEQSGRRPCIILSESLFTQRTGLAVVCPVTSKVKGLPFEIRVSTAKTTGAILPIHIRSIDLMARFPQFIEAAPTGVLDNCRKFVKAIVGI
jgi:mRNA interferase MazF